MAKAAKTDDSTNNPLILFKNWFNEELKMTDVSIPTACCLSTTGLDGYPNARYVSLKEVTEDSLVVTGPLNSRKGLEIEHSNKVALTFWWTKTEKQVRIQGDAFIIQNKLADKYFSERDSESQITSVISEQGKEVEDFESLKYKFERGMLILQNTEIGRPDNWGGYSIKPIRFEFMKFNSSRLHDRKLYELSEGRWVVKQLQP
jgi:pyridoxamine 5'-phosphate oxidase